MKRFFKIIKYLKLFYLLIISMNWIIKIISNLKVLYTVFHNFLFFLLTDSSELSFNIVKIDKINSGDNNPKSENSNKINLYDATDNNSKSQEPESSEQAQSSVRPESAESNQTNIGEGGAPDAAITTSTSEGKRLNRLDNFFNQGMINDKEKQELIDSGENFTKQELISWTKKKGLRTSSARRIDKD
jgi:hypothetical protein